MGYSRLMSLDERATVAALDAARAIFRTHIESNRGRVIDMAGDSVLATFETATGAVSAAMAAQGEINPLADRQPESGQMRFRIGVHLGDVIEKPDGSVYGDGVNIAARLEGLAEPGGITISDSVRIAVKGKIAASFVDQGEQMVKNISDPVRAYRISVGNAANSQPVAAVKPTLSAPAIDLSLPSKPSIAVLPFNNMSGDPEQEYFTDGVTEDIITALSRFHSLFVIARNSSFSFKGKSPDIRQVGKELGVHYVLEGSIRRAGNRIRVTAQLIDALSGNHIWAEKYDHVLEDIFAVQEELTRSIVTAIAPQIDAVEIAKTRRPRPGNFSGYEVGLHAWGNAMDAFWKADRNLRIQAIHLARDALALDGTSRLALKALAWSQCQQVVGGTAGEPEAAWTEGMNAVNLAIELDRSDAIGYSVRAMLLQYPVVGEVKWDDALSDARRAHDLNPNDGLALVILGYTESASGNPRLAVQYLMQQRRLSPNDTLTFNAHTILSIVHNALKDYESTIRWANLAIRDAPNLPQPHLNLAVAFVGLGQIDRAKTVVDGLRRLAPEYLAARLEGFPMTQNPQSRLRLETFLRIAAGLEDPSAADALR